MSGPPEAVESLTLVDGLVGGSVTIIRRRRVAGTSIETPHALWEQTGTG